MTDSTASRYDYTFDPNDVNNTAAKICRHVGHGRNVLELGCAAGAMSAVLTGHYGCRVTGVEYDPAAARKAAEYCESTHVLNLEEPEWAENFKDSQFDTVLAADVLEHLHNPAACLRQIHRLLTPEGRLVISVPNIAHGGVIAALLCGEFEYGDIGLLDRTHVHFFTPASLRKVLQENDFQVELEDAAVAGAWHPEFARYWEALPAPLREWLEQGPVTQVYQSIMVARRVETTAQSSPPDPAVLQNWLQGMPKVEQGVSSDLVSEIKRLLSGLRRK